MGDPRFSTLLVGSEVLLRKALGYFGINSEREIGEVRKAVELAAMKAASEAQAGGQGQGASPASGGTAAGGDVAKQISTQLFGNAQNAGLA
jgi:hypothetical protein